MSNLTENVTWIGEVFSSFIETGVGAKTSDIGTTQPFSVRLLIRMLEHRGEGDPYSLLLRRLRVLRSPTLSHLLALILHPPRSHPFPERGTGLIVIDNISTPFSVSYPPGMDGQFSWKVVERGRNTEANVPSTRRLRIMVELAVGLGRLAAAEDVAVCSQYPYH